MSGEAGADGPECRRLGLHATLSSMKKMRCKDLGGICDMLITGNTPDEMGDAAKAHAMLMIKQGDEDHLAAMKRMQDMSPGEFASFWAEFRRAFEEADEG